MMTRKGLNLRIGLPMLFAVALLLGLLVVGTGNSEGETWHVDDSGGSDYTTIQDAVDNAESGDRIFIHNGYYEENLEIDKTLILQGEDREKVTISGGNESSIITISAENCVIEFLTITNGGMELFDAGIDIVENNITVSHASIRYSKNGIYSGGGYHDLCVDNSTIRSTSKALFLRDYVNIYLDRVELTDNDRGASLSSCREFHTINCNIYGNEDYGVHSNDGINIFAENCWWGHPEGPSIEYSDDKGDKILDVDEYEPYLTSKYVHPNPPQISGSHELTAKRNVEFLKNFACSDGKYPLEWRIETDASWLDLGENFIHGTPRRADVGVYYVLVNVTDDDGRSDEVNFSLTVDANEQPCQISIEVEENYTLNTTEHLKMTISNPDFDTVEYVVIFNNSNHINNLSGTFSTNEFIQDYDLKGYVVNSGFTNITVWAHDGKYNVTSWANMTVLIRPTSWIISILPNPVKEGELVIFNGSGFDEDGTIVGWEWTSDIDGVLSTSKDMENSSLSAGTHTITLRVEDDDGIWSLADNLNLTVIGKQRPTAVINSISPNPAKEWQNITFNGTGTDEDGMTIAYEWSSSLDGVFLYSANGRIDSLSVGNHVISFRVKDDDEMWSNLATMSLKVKLNNTKPVISIIYPEDNAHVSGTVTFSGQVEDEDGYVERVEISIQGGEWITVTGSETWFYIWDSTAVADSEYSIRYRAYDGTIYSEEGVVTLLVENNEPPDDDDDDDSPGFDWIVSILGMLAALHLIRTKCDGYGRS